MFNHSADAKEGPALILNMNSAEVFGDVMNSQLIPPFLIYHCGQVNLTVLFLQ